MTMCSSFFSNFHADAYRHEKLQVFATQKLFTQFLLNLQHLLLIPIGVYTCKFFKQSE